LQSYAKLIDPRDHIGGIPAVIVGSRFIGQAHKPDEYVEIEQFERSEASWPA
jgi:acetylornithine deacetylase/succinyl-diaminopimelate desuccinylase-like protein